MRYRHKLWRLSLQALAKVQVGQLYGVGFVDAAGEATAAHVAARRYRRADINDPVARHFYDFAEGIEQAVKSSTESRDFKIPYVNHNSEYENGKELYDNAQYGVDPSEMDEKAFSRMWFHPLRQKLDALRLDGRTVIKRSAKEISPLGYDEETLLDLDFVDIVKAVAKHDYLRKVMTEYYGVVGGHHAEAIHHSSGASECERADMYDRALVEAVWGLSRTENPSSSFSTYVRDVVGKAPSGIDWISWRTPKDKTMPSGQKRFNQLSDDITIEAARRLGMISPDGVMPPAQVAALHYSRADIRSSIDRHLHGLTKNDRSVGRAVFELLAEVKPRLVMFSGVYYGHIDTPYTREISSYGFIRTEVAEGLSFYKDDPIWQEALATNRETVKALGYAGMRGIDMFFAELHRDFDRIDATPL